MGGEDGRGQEGGRVKLPEASKVTCQHAHKLPLFPPRKRAFGVRARWPAAAAAAAFQSPRKKGVRAGAARAG